MPWTVTLAKEIHAEGLSYRKIAAEMAARASNGQRETSCGVGCTEDAWAVTLGRDRVRPNLTSSSTSAQRPRGLWRQYQGTISSTAK